MKNNSLGYSTLLAICALTLSAVAFGTSASATDTVTPSPMPVVSTDAGTSDDAEISTLLATQPEVTDNAQEADASIGLNNVEDAQEQATFADDIKAAIAVGDATSATQLTTAAAIVTSIDAPELQAVASDDTEAHALILGLPQK